MLPEGDTMNYAYYEGKGHRHKGSDRSVGDAAFFCLRAVLILCSKIPVFLKAGGMIWPIMSEELPETTYYIFIESEIDKRSRLYKSGEGQRPYCGAGHPG